MAMKSSFCAKNIRNEKVLCMKERTTILKYMYEKPDLLINNNSEIYGSSWHKPRFHKFSPQSTGNDESNDGRTPELSEKNIFR